MARLQFFEQQQMFRQNNPLIHASSKMIDTPTYKTELDKTVESLRILLDDEIANLPDSSDQDE